MGRKYPIQDSTFRRNVWCAPSVRQPADGFVNVLSNPISNIQSLIFKLSTISTIAFWTLDIGFLSNDIFFFCNIFLEQGFFGFIKLYKIFFRCLPL